MYIIHALTMHFVCIFVCAHVRVRGRVAQDMKFVWGQEGFRVEG
jgi:hypothetical protein